MTAMRIEIAVPQGHTRHSHAALAERLRGAGHATRFSLHDAPGCFPAGFRLLAMLERTIYQPPLIDMLRPCEFDLRGFDGAADILIDLTGGAAPRGMRTLAPLFDRDPSEAAALSAILDGRAPELHIVEWFGQGDATRQRAHGLPALEQPYRANESLARVAARVNDLLAKTIADISAGLDAGVAVEPSAAQAPCFAAFPRFAASALAGRVAARLRRMIEGGEAWRVGWRRANADAFQQTFSTPNAGYAILPDDGHRYYADPFLFVRDGRTWLFVEEFPYATRKGVISVAEVSAAGIVGPPRPVLEAPFHLSWPFVFERDGEVYMMPEARGGGSLRLYRAERFPDKWVEAHVLLSDIICSDASLVEWGGLLWLFLSDSTHGQSDWDTLRLFHAPDLDGPWTPHRFDPALIDASQARGAGHFFQRDGVLYRPTQDCRSGYGAGLAICAIERLDLEGFGQRVVARFGPKQGQRLQGVHTLNAAGGIEVVDFVGAKSSFQPTGWIVNHQKP